MTADSFSAPDVGAMEIVGGCLALDLVNTTNWTNSAPVDDRIIDDGSVEIWLERVGLWSTSTMRVDDLRELRFTVRRLFVDGVTLHEIEHRIDELVDSDVPATDRKILLALLFSAIELHRSEKLKRVRVCPGPRCGWLFVDESPAGRRRWCSMRACGNRAKVREHYRRTSTTDA